MLNILKYGPEQQDNNKTSITPSTISGFGIGHSIHVCTKGIWLWGEPVYIDGQKMAVLFLDTEGLGSVKASATQDARIFALTLLITSYFVYFFSKVFICIKIFNSKFFLFF